MVPAIERLKVGEAILYLASKRKWKKVKVPKVEGLRPKRAEPCLIIVEEGVRLVPIDVAKGKAEGARVGEREKEEDVLSREDIEKFTVKTASMLASLQERIKRLEEVGAKSPMSVQMGEERITELYTRLQRLEEAYQREFQEVYRWLQS